LKPEEICFVGNGDNDEYAHLSGCKTICINPEETDGNNKTLWHTTLNNVTNLTQLLDEILK
jgi:FMN phosphatase YigB (HAD superfamily)